MEKQMQEQIVNSSKVMLPSEEAEEGKVKINEQVLPTGHENEFEVQIDVLTDENVSAQGSSQDSAVLILVDKSSSMGKYSPIILDSEQYEEVVREYEALSDVEIPVTTEYVSGTHKLTQVEAVLSGLGLSEDIRQKIYNCYHRRAWFERKAVIDFLDSYTSDIPEGTNRYFALASVHKDAKRQLDWKIVTEDWRSNTEITTLVFDYTGGSDLEPWNTDVFQYDFDKTVYTNGSGSNIEGAYILADNLMKQVRKDYGIPAENTKAFFISDGEPTKCALDHNAEAVDRVKGSESTVTVYSEEILENIQKRSASDKHNINIVWYGNATLDNSIYNLENGHTAFADNFFDAGTSEKISELWFSKIIIEETEEFVKIDPWVVDVPLLSSRFKYKGITDEWKSADPGITENWDSDSREIRVECAGSSERVRSAGEAGESDGEFEICNALKLKWDLKSWPYVMEDGFCHYRMNYCIILDNTDDDFHEGEIYLTNDISVLSYTITEDGLFSSLRTVQFDTPSVKGYMGKFDFKKEDNSGNALEGAEFELTCNQHYAWESIGPWKMISDETGKVRFAEKDAKGKVSFLDPEHFSGIPSGRDYTLRETAAPEGFKSDGKTYQVHVNYGKVTFDEGMDTLTVVNDPKKPDTPTPSDALKGDLIVSKTVSGSGADRNKKFTFTVTLVYTASDAEMKVPTPPNAKMVHTSPDAAEKTAGSDKKIVETRVLYLADGENYVFSGLKEGTLYNVTESDNNGYEVSVRLNETGEYEALAGNLVSGKIEGEKTSIAAFRNHKDQSGEHRDDDPRDDDPSDDDSYDPDSENATQPSSENVTENDVPAAALNLDGDEPDSGADGGYPGLNVLGAVSEDPENSLLCLPKLGDKDVRKYLVLMILALGSMCFAIFRYRKLGREEKHK